MWLILYNLEHLELHDLNWIVEYAIVMTAFNLCEIQLILCKPIQSFAFLETVSSNSLYCSIFPVLERRSCDKLDLLRNKLYYWAVTTETPLADPTRHIKKKQLRDISHKIRRVQLRMHNRKAKCYIPELLVELNSLFKQRESIRNGNIMRTPHIPRPQKSVCNYRIDKGYHICKPNPSRSLQS